MKNRFLSVQDVTLIAIFAVIICVCSFIQIPFGVIPFTLQTFGICVTAGMLGLKRGTLAVSTYIVLGVVGLPVFRGLGGIGVLIGPTGGFIIGFILTAVIIGLVSDKIKHKRKKVVPLFISMIIGNAVCMLFGCIQYMIVADVNLISALVYCVLPFIVTDLIKVILSTFVVLRVRTFK